ncbi:energy transducer TonB [Pseudoalteromonas sp. OANN1]|uniref:energy transducer TonB n=1 Tax=Pseudoalteromonas sp. OANN1 TaxID=2954497 RepID=UPI002097D777|nr:energy transducer TonB [Pseudoalteromonas sp. OANN1]MCO7200670.1 energy transducer TonB [Pseudoalteromonas sp. OANN1]
MENFIKSTLMTSVLFVSLTTGAFAKSEPNIHLSTIVNASAVERVAPQYPRNVALVGGEGWVTLSYIINEDGSVASPIVENSSGQKGFERAALRAIKRWQYSPATKDGKPIKQCKNSVMFSFNMSDAEEGASRGFVRSYRNINNLLDESKLIEAKEHIDKLAKKGRWNRYEEAYFNLVKARYFQLTAEPRQELEAHKGIIWHGKDIVKSELYANALINAIKLQTQLQEYKGALKNHKKLMELDGQDTYKSAVQPVIDEIVALIADKNKMLVIAAEIKNDDVWTHTLARPNFAIAEVSGALHTLEVRCDNQFSQFKFAENMQWNIPKSWGECNVVVFGEPNSSFKLIEVQS